MKTNKLLIGIVLLSLSNLFQIENCKAQKYFELANTGFLLAPKHESEYSGNKTSFSNVYFNLRLPKVLENKDIFIFGLTTERFNISHSSSTLNTGLRFFNKSVTYYNTGLFTGYVHNWNTTFNTSITLGQYIASDYKKIGNNNYRFDVLVLFTHKTSETFKYKYGILYKNEFSGKVIWPGAGFDWALNSKSFFSVLLPQYIKYNYYLSPKISLGSFLWVNMATYRMDNENVYLDQQLSEIMFTAGYFITEKVLIQAMVGSSLSSFSKFYANSDKFKYKIAGQFIENNRTDLNLDFKRGLLLELRLSYNLPLTKTDNSEK